MAEPHFGSTIVGSVKIEGVADNYASPRDIMLARRWFTHVNYYGTNPAPFVSADACDTHFDEMCEENAFSAQILKAWAQAMHKLDNSGEDYNSWAIL